MTRSESKPKAKASEGVLKGVFVAYFVLLLHVLLLVGLGCLVLFFRGFVEYMLYIFLGGTALILTSALLLIRRMRRERKSLGQALDSPAFRGRSVEVSFLGGIASLRLGTPTEAPLIGGGPGQGVPQLESPSAARVRELRDLANLYEDDLITREEFDRAKQELLGI